MPDEQVVEQQTTETPSPETAPEETTETPETPETPPPPDPAELERKLKASEREIERHRKRADYFMQQTDLLTRQQTAPPVKAEAPESLGPEPLLGQFETTDDWQKAHTQWLRKSVVQEVLATQQQQAEVTRRQYQEQQEQVRVNEQRELIRQTSQRDPSFAQAAEIVGQIIDNGAGKIHPAATTLYNELFESDNYEALVRHFAANPNEIYRITALKPNQQIKEIARLENQLPATPKVQPSASVPAVPVSPLRLSQAPPPARPPNGASASAKAIDLNDPNVPIDVWMKEHDRREREKRKRGMG